MFLAHGSPMSALGGDDHAAALHTFGRAHRDAKAILIVSAHWQVSKPLRLSAWDRAPLVYDFGGFPQELYQLTYPAPGNPVLAARVAGVLRAEGHDVTPQTDRGLDHGAWVPLRLAWPEAATPVLELSFPFVSPEELFQLGKALRPLRDDGILVAGSGGIVHNLRRVHLDNKQAAVDDWAAEFDAWIAAQVESRNLEKLFAYRSLGPHARLSAPATEHFDPLFIALGAAFPEERVETIFAGFQYGNLSMRSFSFSSARS
ncbi:Extradiol ring-cleavage dioxygenase, class III enzyme, subunit B [Candidatus Sulfopaludibacter sp. SbA4]|nr:Extradiol ring-cleavage dioxygenase, class III enzyme, subunit B [Candidatus Sulfopaludibacter sp. SbA4]